MSKEVMNPGVEFTLPPEDTYNYKIPDKSGVNDEPEVSGDYYILFKDKLSELKRAITDPEILIEYHIHNLVYANSLPKIEEKLKKKLEYTKDSLYDFYYYNENMEYASEESKIGYFKKKGLRYPTFMIPYNQNSTPIRFYVDIYKTDNSGNVIEHVIKNPFDTLRDNGGTPEELKELQDHMSNLIINADQYTSPLKMLAYEFDDVQSNPNRIGIYFDSFASNGSQNYSDILYVGVFFDGFTYNTDSNYIVEIKYSIDKKYELIGEPVIVGGKEVYRTRALKDFGDVKIGDVGGFVESEENLSQFGTCWLYNESKAIDKAKIVDNAKVYGTTIVMDGASISNNVTIGVKDFIVKPYIEKDNELYTNSIFKSQYHGTPLTYIRDYFNVNSKTDNANSYIQHIKNLKNRFEDYITTDIIISDKAIIKNNAKILLDTRISGNAIVKDNAIVGSPLELDEEMHPNAKWDKYETAIIYVDKSAGQGDGGSGQTAIGPYGYDKTPYKYTDITDSAIIAENAYVRGKVTGTSIIKGTSYIHKRNQIQGNTTISGDCVLLNGFLQYSYNMIHNSTLTSTKFISADSSFIDTVIKSNDFESFNSLFSQSYMLGEKYVVGPDTVAAVITKLESGESMWYNSDIKFIRCKSIEGSSIISGYSGTSTLNRPEFYDCVFEGSNILNPKQFKANVDNSYNLLTVSGTNTTSYYSWLAELDNLIQAKTNTTYLNDPYFAKMCRMRFKNGVLTTAMKYMIDYADYITINPRQIDINNTDWYVPPQTYQQPSFKVYRIIATENFGNITKGTKGGYVQSYANLSIYNESWIESGSVVAMRSHVTDNAKVKGSSNLIGDCVIADSAEVFSTTIVGHSTMTGTVTSGDGNISYSSVYISGAAMVYYALLQGDVTITDHAVIQGRGVSNKMVYSPYYGYTPNWIGTRNGSLIMRDNSQIIGNVKIHCTSHVEMHNRASIDSNNGETTLIGGPLELYMYDTSVIANKGTNNATNMASTITGLTNLISSGEVTIYDDQTKNFRDPHNSYHLTPSGGSTFVAMYDNSSIDMTMSQITYGTNLIMSGQSKLTMNRSIINETSLEMNQFTKVNMKGSNKNTITPTVIHDVTPVGCQFISSNLILNDTSFIDMDEDRMQVYADLANTRKITTCILAGANVTLNHASFLRDAIIKTEGWFAGDQNEASWHYMYSTMCNKSIYGSANPAQATKYSEKLDYNTTPTLVLTQRACMDNVYMGKFSHKPTSDFIKSNVGIVDQNLLNIGDVILTLFGEVHFDPRTHLNTVNFDSFSLPVQYFTPDITQTGLLKGYIKSAFEKPAKEMLGTEKAIMYYIGNYKKKTDGSGNPRYYLSTTAAPRAISDALTRMSPRWRYNKYYREINIAPIYIAELYRMYQKKNDDTDYTDFSNTATKADATLPNSFFSHFGETSGEECLLDLANYHGLIFNNSYIESTKFTYDNTLRLGTFPTIIDINMTSMGIVNNVYMNGLDYKTKSKIFYLPKDINFNSKKISYNWTPTTILNLSNYADQYLLENLSIGINSGGTATNNGDTNYASFGKNIIYSPSPLFRRYGKQFNFKHKRVFSAGSTPSPLLEQARQMIHEINVFPVLEDSLMPPVGEFGVTDPSKRTKRDHYIYIHANVVYNAIFNISDYNAIPIDKETMDGNSISGYDVSTKTTIDGYYKNVLSELKTGTRMNLVSIGTSNDASNLQYRGPRFQYPVIIGHTSPSDDLSMLYKRPYIIDARLSFTTDTTKYKDLNINRYSPPSTLPVGFYASVVDADNPIPRITQLHRFLNTPQIYGAFTVYSDKLLNTIIDNKSTLLVSDYNDSISSTIPFVKEQMNLYDNYRYYLYRYGSQQTGNNIHFRKDISLFKNNIKKMEWFSGHINEMMMIGYAFDGFEVINQYGYAPFKAVSPKCIKSSQNSIEKISIMGQIGTTVAAVHSKMIYNQAINYNLFDQEVEVYASDSLKTRYLFSAERNTPYANLNTRYETIPEPYIPYTNNIFKSGIIFSHRYPSDIKIMGDDIDIIGISPAEKGSSGEYFQPFAGWRSQIDRFSSNMTTTIPNEPEGKLSSYLGMSYRRSERNVSDNLDVLMTPYNLNNIFPLYTKDLNYTYDHVNGFKIMGSKYDHLSFKQLYEDNIYNNSKYDRARVYLHQDLNTISYPDRSEYPPDAPNAPISYITTATNANEYFDVSYFGLPTQLDLVGVSTYNEAELGGDTGYYMYPKTMTKYSLMNIANGYSGLNATTDLSKIHSSNPAYNQYQGAITGTKLLNPYMYAMRQSNAYNALGIYFVNNYVSKTSFPYGFKYNETAYHEFKDWNLYSSGSGQREYLYVQTMLPLEDENGTYTEVHDTFENKTNEETFIYNNKKVTTYAPSSYRYYYYGMYKD